MSLKVFNFDAIVKHDVLGCELSVAQVELPEATFKDAGDVHNFITLTFSFPVLNTVDAGGAATLKTKSTKTVSNQL